MNPPRRKKPRPLSPSKVEVNPPRRKKPRSSDPLKTEVDPLRRKTPPPGYKSYEEFNFLKMKMEEIKKELFEAQKNFDTKRDEKFWEDWEISDGFDVDYPELGTIGSPVVIKDANSCSPYLRDSAYECAGLAIKYENDHKNSNLELLEVVKFNFESHCGHVYYLTFKAKDREDGRVCVYQSQVFIPQEEVVRKDHKDRERKIEVRMFRKKPSEYQQSKGQEYVGVEKKRKTKEGCATVHSRALKRSAKQRRKKNVFVYIPSPRR